ncbi:hypothetical protein CN931_25175 [Bacillus sp. AFS054943]|uniref:PXO1-76 n=1 Tax=Bacillus cereus TaxID=1396 RepID=A0A2C1LNM9_BACCE|nr:MULTISPECIES: hypothetical protein [Bacillus]PGL77247.1 hypothetical protein CN931_25175 [Bacillus sp. AFS054943]PGT99488.1 hypothetical protein COD19_19415 [Bacillus cereus]TKI39099.1 hypothetical protein FC700_21825 [Bacillus mycoides]
MIDLLYFAAFGVVLLFMYKLFLDPKAEAKRREKERNKPSSKKGSKKNGKKSLFGRSTTEDEDTEEELGFLKELMEEVKEFKDHMILLNDGTFVMIAEVKPTNYALASPEEQEIIDTRYELWLAQIEGNTKVHLQNRYKDLTEPIKEMQRNMNEATDLPAAALMYGQEVIDNLQFWLRSNPRYEQRRYIILTYKPDMQSLVLEAEDDDEEIQDALFERAFSELFRRFNASADTLKKAKMKVDLLTKDGLIELAYVSLNRKKAIKNRWADMVSQGNFSLYTTGDYSDRKLDIYKKEVAKYQKEKAI